MGLGIRPINDFAFRKVFASPQSDLALLSLLNAIIEPVVPITKVSLQNPFNYQDFETDKLSILDIKATDQNGAIYDIEMQIAVKPGLVQRLVFYGAELYSDQLRSGDEYRQLKPVIIIALVEDVVWSESGQRHHRFELTDRPSGRVLADTLSIHIVELEKYNSIDVDLSHVSPLERWVFWLRHAQDYDVRQLCELFPGNEFDVVNSLLLEISQQTKDKSMYDAQEKQRRDRLWLQNIAIEEAEQRGELRGELRGKQRGELSGKIRILQEILGLAVSSDRELDDCSLDELHARLVELQVRVKSRS